MTGHPRTLGRRRARAASTGLVTLALLAALSGCSLGSSDDEAAPTPTQAPTSAAATDDLVDSQFTRDGTFQSHVAVPGVDDVDFVYTLYPTKATPRTNEWYPGGKKYFSFTFQAYDLARGLRAPFAAKRRVYLDTIQVTSSTITTEGGATQHPYRLDVVAKDATFDPEPLVSRYGMIITSPKGAFEIRNQAIGSVSSDTAGVELVFRAVVHVQTEPGSSRYVRRVVEQVVPIAIFASDEPTRATKIPINAN